MVYLDFFFPPKEPRLLTERVNRVAFVVVSSPLNKRTMCDRGTGEALGCGSEGTWPERPPQLATRPNPVLSRAPTGCSVSQFLPRLQNYWCCFLQGSLGSGGHTEKPHSGINASHGVGHAPDLIPASTDETEHQSQKMGVLTVSHKYTVFVN